MEGFVEFKVNGIDTPCKTWYKVFGHLKSRRPLVALHGGPGIPHNYLLSLADLADTHSIPVVLYDQLGNGNSTHLPEKNGDTAFWTEALFIAELENLLKQLGIQDDFDLLGQSWGGMMGARFAATRPPGLKNLILSNSLTSMKLWIEAANTLRAQLPQDIQDTLDKHEADGTTDSAEYQNAVQIFYSRHVCRLDPMPQEVLASFKALEKDPTVYYTMFGPSEFHVTGPLKDWTVADDIHLINVPTLLLNGHYDEAQDSVQVGFFRDIEKVKWFTFAESSHMPMWEEREKYMRVVGDFLTQA
ncbi:L-amino acid amidase [Trametes pubescens]|uniref:L-amino acid amidase n=1 Tax=Trametes pubescens TaxID=154538 RepID=A0A1M2VGE5_TRAPU|nr:L-amino acid amidase [Trametes pubescens]